MITPLPPNYLLAALIVIVAGAYFLTKEVRRQRNRKIIKREKHFRGLADSSLHPFILKNAKGQIIFASESIKAVLGLKNNIRKGSKLADHVHPEDKAAHASFLDQVLRVPSEKRTIEVRIRQESDPQKSDWTWIRIDSINLLDHPDINAVVSTLQDISFQKEIDKEKAEIIRQEKGARSLAEKAIRDRDEFLAIASHELKTPLTTVLLQLQSTLRKISTQSLTDFSGADLLKSLQIAENQGQRLSVLIKDLLNVSVASAGKLGLDAERVDLVSLVRTLLLKYEQEIKISGSKVEFNIRAEDVVGYWDPVRIEQAISNIFLNALKYSDKKTIKVGVSKSDGWAKVRIVDKGEGIAKEYQELIFEPFKRANGGQGPEGLGVGLFIAKQIATAHGGNITLSSTPGKGAAFTLRLPLAKPAATKPEGK